MTELPLRYKAALCAFAVALFTVCGLFSRHVDDQANNTVRQIHMTVEPSR